MFLPEPQFFDIFGAVGFVYIVVLSFSALIKKNPLPRWTFAVLLLIGLAGLAVDAMVVYTFYLR